MEENRGNIITALDNMFGSQIDHEIIKMVLQSSDWNKYTAAERLHDMLSSSSISENSVNNSIDLCKVSSMEKKNNKSSLPLKESEIRDIVTKKKLILMRGLPGSGKTTLAKSFIEEHGVVNSTDDFFYDSRGNYSFDCYNLSHAHAWNRQRTDLCMKDGISPVVIDNTNIESWEMQPYAILALKYNYDVEIVEPQTPWKFKPYQLSRKNKHNVSKTKIEDMLSKYRNISVENIIPSEYRKVQSVGGYKINGLPIEPHYKNKGLDNMQKENNNIEWKDNKSPNNDTVFNATDEEKSSPVACLNQRCNTKKCVNLVETCDNGNNLLEASTLGSSAATSSNSSIVVIEQFKEFVNKETQVSLANDKYDFILYGNANRFTSALNGSNLPTKHENKIDAGCMTNEIYNCPSSIMARKQLSLAFPSCSEKDLVDILEKCNYDIDWTVNILIDGGYEMYSNFDASYLFDESAELLSNESENDIKIISSFEESNYCHSEKIQSTESDIFSSHDGSRNVNQVINLSDDQITNSSIELPSDCKVESEMADISLDETFAKKLIDLFGPIGTIDGRTPILQENRSVKLPVDLCKILYNYWKITCEALPVGKQERCSFDSVVDETPSNLLYEKFSPCESPTAKLEVKGIDPFLIESPQSFREIMNVEQAVENSLKNKYNGPRSIARVLNLQKLKSEYPNIDPIAVEANFIENSCNYGKTKVHLTSTYDNLPLTHVRISEHCSTKSIQQNQDETVKSVGQCREEGQMHFLKKKEALKMAHENIQKKMYAVASHYSQIASYHSIKQKECNEKAAHHIVQESKYGTAGINTLDLHYLHVSEAVQATQLFASEKIKYLRERHLKHIEVKLITGYGKSSHEAPRIKPTIVKYLTSLGHHVRTDPYNPGMLIVLLKL